VHDVLGNDDGTIHGGVSPLSSHESPTGEGMSFDGATGYIDLSSANNLDTQSWTVEAWFESTHVGGSYGQIYRNRLFGQWVGVMPNGSPDVGICPTADSGPWCTWMPTPGANALDGHWHYLVGTHEGSRLTLYVDGSQVGQETVHSGTYYQSGGISIGQDGNCGCGYFQGDIAAVAFYDHALTLHQVATHYLSALPHGSFLTPDVSIVQYISSISQGQCVSQLRRSLGIGPKRAGAACLFLVATANPKPPRELASASQWLAFIQSREYRGYVHLPQMAVVCNRGKPESIDGQSIKNVSTGAVPLNLPDFSWSPGWTPPRPVSLLPGADYEPAEEYTNGPDDLGQIFDDLASIPEVSVHKNGTVVISFLSASRLATLERTVAFPLIGRDAPFIWSVLQLRFNCAGSEAVSVANSELPTTNLYINGRLKSWYTQNHLGDFTKDGQTKNNAPGVGLLALDPTCGTSLRWANSQNHIQAKVPPGQ
jgi:Concanavalin A-like lectin/glucanases superfamily